MSSGGVAGLEAALPLRKLGGERIGDATDFAIKHGGIAAQQADVAAQAIAALAGVAPEPAPFHPVIHGILLTGGKPRYLSAHDHRRPWIELADYRGADLVAAEQDCRQVPRAVPGETRPPRKDQRMIAAIVNLNHPANTVHWHFFSMSVANVVVIVLLLVVFAVAILAPFPGHGGTAR